MAGARHASACATILRLRALLYQVACATILDCVRYYTCVRPEISETLGLGLDHFPGLGLDLGLENTHFPGLGLGLSLKYS